MSLTRVAVHLVLRDDDLAGIGVVGVLDRMAEDADDADHLTCFTHSVLNVARVTDQLLTASNLRDQETREPLR